jgi:fumarate reductase flavoprotein subunit
MMKAMDDQARKLGVNVLLRTKAAKILKNEGRVFGLIGEHQTGKRVRIHARAVVIGTGGFGSNPEMVNKHTRYEVERDIFPMRIAGIAGEGIQIAWEAGAARGDMTMQLISSLKPPYNGRGGTREELAAFRQPNLMVNLNGERFMNEEILANTTFSGNAIFEQTGSRGFIIFDEDTKREYEKNGMHYCDTATVKDLDANIRGVLEEGCDCIFVADSLEELSKKTGIDANALQHTVDKYNEMCQMGRDPIMNKSAHYLRPIKQPKFYAGMHVPSAYGSLGGIKINHRTEVLDDKAKIIPGLYSIGTDANAINGESYTYIFPGSTLGFALNSGRIGGGSAATYAAMNHLFV